MRPTNGRVLWLLALGATVTLLGGQMRAEKSGDLRPPLAVKEKKASWKKLYDGKSLSGWKEAKFGGEGEVYIENGAIIMSQGNDMTGITYAKDDLPKTDYEIEIEAKKVKGNDFFCTTTFPVGKDYCSLVVGGWGGGVVGLSSIDDRDASENETGQNKSFERNQWYKVRIRVGKGRIAAWIDNKEVVNFATKGHRISIRPECDLCKPLGIATWRTQGAVRDVRVRALGN